MGLRISFLHTIISMRRVITLAGGMCFPAPATAAFGCSSAVELDPNLLSPAGPAFPPSSSACSPSFAGNFNSSPPNSPSAAALFPTNNHQNQNHFLKIKRRNKFKHSSVSTSSVVIQSKTPILMVFCAVLTRKQYSKYLKELHLSFVK